MTAAGGAWSFLLRSTPKLYLKSAGVAAGAATVVYNPQCFSLSKPAECESKVKLKKRVSNEIRVLYMNRLKESLREDWLLPVLLLLALELNRF
jgi:hypothetical protein